MRIRESTLSRAFVLVTAAMVTAVWALVIPVWEHSDPKREGLSPSQALLDAFMADLCRPPTSTETIYWDTKPFTLRELSGTIRASADGIRVRALRRIYLDVLLRDPFEGDCAGLRRWVERPVTVEDVARRFATSPEGRRVAAVRDALREVQGRDPAGWDNASVRRWTESGLTPAEIKLRVANQRPLVGVHYFTWYQRDNTSWGNGGSAVVPDDTQQPTLGWYESRDVGTIDRHIEQMEAAGFDFAIVQMVAIAPHIWETTHRFFDRLEGRRLKAVVMLDGLYGSASVTTGWVEKAKAEFGVYSNYLTVRGEPLVLLYSSRLDFPVPGVQLRNVYWSTNYGPGDNPFNPDSLLYPHDWPFWSPTPQPLVNGVVTVVPGYSDAHLGRDRSMDHPRNGGRMYHDQWRRALALRPEFIIVYSWNEHFERTAIEPTVAWGDQYVKWTACYVAHAHAGREGPC